ncbi:hypothetical protein PIB30_088864 [Stylosanthes scabra]|uniref:Uncharacterized protein n=1 Tax=Stylosanthes scabra TaxID=79078 RepID=A0ABU6UUK7_9FABA|nr:hypothetical protein [Stylosanthes scabra]
MPLEPRASWFSLKCVEAQQLTGHLGVKHCFGAGRESGTKSRQTLNTRYDLKITRVKVGQRVAGRLGVGACFLGIAQPRLYFCSHAYTLVLVAATAARSCLGVWTYVEAFVNGAEGLIEGLLDHA